MSLTGHVNTKYSHHKVSSISKASYGEARSMPFFYNTD